MLVAEAFGRQDAGLHASAIGAPSATFAEPRVAFGRGSVRSFASSASVLAPFRGTPRVLAEEDVRGAGAVAEDDDDDDEDADEDEFDDGSDALLDLPEIETMSRKKQQCVSSSPLSSTQQRPMRLTKKPYGGTPLAFWCQKLTLGCSNLSGSRSCSSSAAVGR